MNQLDDTLLHRIRRQISHKFERNILARTQRPIVTFSFDDCPLSVIETALPILEAEDWRATIYVCVGLCDTTNHLGLHMSENDIVTTYKRGHEIGDHTFSHINARTPSTTDYLVDIEKNQQALEALGIKRSLHFAYPFGDVTTPIKARVKNKFKTARGVLPPTSPDLDANYLPAMPLYSGKNMEAAIEKIETLSDQPLWLNLYTHDVRDNPSDFGCTPDEFKRVVDAVKAASVQVLPVCDAYDLICSTRRMVA